MAWFAESWRRLRSIPQRARLERSLDAEMRFHVDQQTEKNRRAGMSPEEARRRALVTFGGLERAKESTRDEFRPAVLEDAVRDLRYGMRVLRRSPGFAVVALITLALGIGATSAIFSVVRAVMMTPLPYREPDRLVTIWETNRGGTARNVISAANFIAWRERTRTLDHLTTIAPATEAMVADGRAYESTGFSASADLFPALGVQPALGRAYTSHEDFRGDSTVVVVGYEFWQTRLGGRSDVLGMLVTMSGQPRNIIGVMPAGFTVVGQKADFLIPVADTVEQMRSAIGRGNSYALARLRDGVSARTAADEMRRLYAELALEVPQRNAGRTVMLFSLEEQMLGEVKPALLTLAGAVVLVLLVACVNVANLLLARSRAREREVALRAALGARRGRLIRQMIVESVLLAGGGGIAGLAVAWASHRGLLALVGGGLALPRIDQITLDLPIVAFTLAVSVATGIAFGLVPALLMTSRTRDDGRHGGEPRLRRALNVLVVAEVAASLVLLAGAGLLMRTFLNLEQIDPGFRAEGVLTARVPLPPTRYTLGEADAFFRDTRARLAALPGVEQVAGTQCLPLAAVCMVTSFSRADLPTPPDGRLSSAHVRPITPAFFRSLGTAQLAGRDFLDSDQATTPPVAIVSESLVREQFGSVDPLGKHLRIGSGADADRMIVGVVHDIKLTSLQGAASPAIYIPVAQSLDRTMSFILRTRQDPASYASAVARVVNEREPEAPVDVRTLDDIVDGTLARPRITVMLVSIFAAVALVLAAVGVYGVMAYSVRERTGEIGLRLALGASASSLFALVLGWSLRLVCVGVAAGLVLAGVVTRLIAHLLYGVAPFDAWTFALSALLLLVVAALASYIPARRGMHLAPLDALRAN